MLPRYFVSLLIGLVPAIPSQAENIGVGQSQYELGSSRETTVFPFVEVEKMDLCSKLGPLFKDLEFNGKKSSKIPGSVTALTEVADRLGIGQAELLEILRNRDLESEFESRISKEVRVGTSDLQILDSEVQIREFLGPNFRRIESGNQNSNVQIWAHERKTSDGAAEPVTTTCLHLGPKPEISMDSFSREALNRSLQRYCEARESGAYIAPLRELPVMKHFDSIHPKKYLKAGPIALVCETKQSLF